MVKVRSFLIHCLFSFYLELTKILLHAPVVVTQPLSREKHGRDHVAPRPTPESAYKGVTQE